ncbi:U32 family peptidase [bacterium]|nr:U32 family peptidase [bacterium]
MIELLAPAQTLEHGIAAINCGADAVYIGASAFGARKNAPNSLEDIKTLVNYAHQFNVKIYVTINTILKDDELKEAQKLINELYKIGVDAIIVQDMGLLNIELPPIPIFASTQCNNRDLEKIKFFENIGIKRVILARELSIEQIRNICQNTNLEVETFIHGALCVSYSGQCYLSASIGWRSANRGECAQPCRKTYSLIDKKTGKYIKKDAHLLCLKDFNGSKHIKALIDAGVTSFKIEGRLKDVNYVKNTVLYYRQLIDQIAPKSSSGKIIADFTPDINKTFNRGYTDYFLEKRKLIHNFISPKFTGESIGKVKSSNENYFTLDNKTVINKQDGLCYIENDTVKGFLVNNVMDGKIYPNKKIKLPVNTMIYRNIDTEFNQKLTNSKTKRVLEVSLKIDTNKKTICAKDTENNEYIMNFDYDETANNSEKMKDTFIQQFKKTGNTNIEFTDIEFVSDTMPFLKIAELNKIRRNLCEKILYERVKNYKGTKQESIKPSKYPQEELDYHANVFNKEAKKFYEKCGCTVKEYAPEYTNDFRSKELMRTKHCLKFALGKCRANEEWLLEDSEHKKYQLIFDCKNCEMVIKNL